MNPTGIVRRIDELGRIVIPREIRRTLGIEENAPLELFIDKEGHAVMFKKYMTDEGTEASKILEDLENGVEGMPTEEVNALKALLNHYYTLRGEA